MDATLCDTVGAQVIVNNKRQKGGSASSSLPGRSAKNAAKTQVSPPSIVVRPNGDFATAAAANSVATVAVCASDAPQMRPAFALGTYTLTNTTIAPSPLISSAAPTSTSLGSVSHVSRKTPSFRLGTAAPFRRSGTSNPLNVSSSSVAVPVPAPLFVTTTKATGSELHGRRKGDAQAGAAVGLHEALKRQEEQAQEEQAHLERAARRRLEAREKRRERREVRMAESLGRIATALELLSSKQDTVIALLQRLADRK